MSATEVAVRISEALSDAGIDVVLSGGGATAFYTRGAVRSQDLDFVTAASRKELDPVMQALGFRRAGAARFYQHADVSWSVEFPSGPLAIGRRLHPESAEVLTDHGCLRVLSVTSACEDRLIQWLAWGVTEALYAAAEIAARNPEAVDQDDVLRFLAEEGAGDPELAQWHGAVDLARSRLAPDANTGPRPA
ncbi:hypothetical protein RM531_13970 [Salinisphaera sp. P385]|uniref:Nucleotidyltransferase family protein n=1 Tax=Spectribacter acetivorans TaxID=3075603 RepID=A0ABU3BC50_9GAMM|nr:hypothetical protein [Salinisphaera sp. P385]MDT0619580.1 hypothetical protein [Salinisphaera sp. P385]